MFIKEDLVYEKQTGKLICFVNLGDVSNCLLAYEQMIDGDESDESNLAKTMMVFMVRGLFTRLRFPYAQFPCASVKGDLLFHPFWQAVFKLEPTFTILSPLVYMYHRCWVLPLMVHQLIGTW